MNDSELTFREQQILHYLVKGFITSAEPVGSRFLAKNYDLNISPATIRNVMADLEEKGYIWQPHTSAGRMPTTYGYRKYVDNLDPEAILNEDEKRSIIEQLQQFSKDMDQIVTRSAQVISEITNQLGIILSPRFITGRLDKIDLVPLANQRYLVVLNIQSRLVKTVIVELESDFDPDDLYEITRTLNERLAGYSVEQITRYFDTRFTDVDEKTRSLVGAIKEKTLTTLKQELEGDFYFSGAKNVITQPEFGTQEKMGKILELLDRRDVLIRVLNESTSDGISIVIGDESKEELMQNCSLITTSYSINGSEGTLGVIGPTRMEYAKIILLVKFMAETLGYLMNKPE